MAFIDEIPGQVTAVQPSTWTWDDGTDDSLWDTRRNQAQSLHNIRESSGQMTWAVRMHLLFFSAISAESAEEVREGLLALAANAVIWADQIDARS